MNAIEVKNVTKTYSLYQNEKDILKEIVFGGNRHTQFTALKNVSFNVKKGETYGILGGNGSGKSTVLNIINGTTYPTKGEVKTKGSISLLNVGAGILPGYTGVENIYYKCGLMGLSKKKVDEKLESIKEFSELGDFLYQKVNKYSSGMRSKLGFAIAIHIEPDILIVDEALAVGDSRFVKKCHDKMDELKQKGITILYVSHSHGMVKTFCTRAAWINQGEFIVEGDPEVVSYYYEKFMERDYTIEEIKKIVKESSEEDLKNRMIREETIQRIINTQKKKLEKKDKDLEIAKIREEKEKIYNLEQEIKENKILLERITDNKKKLVMHEMSQKICEEIDNDELKISDLNQKILELENK